MTTFLRILCSRYVSNGYVYSLHADGDFAGSTPVYSSIHSDGDGSNEDNRIFNKASFGKSNGLSPVAQPHM